MLMSWEMMKRRLREGVEFFRFLRAHESVKGQAPFGPHARAHP
jgi:hypothetical protein